VGEYQVDVKDFRTDDKAYLLKQIYEMTETRCKLVRKMIVEKPWDFFMFVEMGVDRSPRHVEFTDERHWRYQRAALSIRSAVPFISIEIGEMLACCGIRWSWLCRSRGEVHGGRHRRQQWLRREGYWCWRRTPATMTPLKSEGRLSKTKRGVLAATMRASS
jgi:hypothetical protein